MTDKLPSTDWQHPIGFKLTERLRGNHNPATAENKSLEQRQTKAAQILWISANSQPRRHAAKDFERDRGKSGRAGPRDGMLCFVDSLTARM